jgi:hypothetical protein
MAADFALDQTGRTFRALGRGRVSGVIPRRICLNGGL